MLRVRDRPLTTPVLDVKPYVPLFDAREGARAGWFETAGERVHEVRSDRRYEPAANRLTY